MAFRQVSPCRQHAHHVLFHRTGAVSSVHPGWKKGPRSPQGAGRAPIPTHTPLEHGGWGFPLPHCPGEWLGHRILCQHGAAHAVALHAASLCLGPSALGSGTSSRPAALLALGSVSPAPPGRAPRPPLCAHAVPSASMTRLARSRTASLTSASSVEGARPRACTHSESSEAMGQINHTMEVSC